MTNNAEYLFRTIETAKDEISEEKSKEIAASIIDVLKQHQLTYSQAHSILDTTRLTLTAMSELLAL